MWQLHGTTFFDVGDRVRFVPTTMAFAKLPPDAHECLAVGGVYVVAGVLEDAWVVLRGYEALLCAMHRSMFIAEPDVIPDGEICHPGAGPTGADPDRSIP